MKISCLRIVVLVALFMVGNVYAPSAQKIDGWNNVKFGMTRDEVLRLVPGTTKDQKSCDKDLLSYFKDDYPAYSCEKVLTWSNRLVHPS